MKPCMTSRFTTIRPGTPRGPCADGTPSYCEIAPAGDAAAVVHQRETCLENVAADIVEVDVDALGGGGPQRLESGAVLVIDRGVEAEFAGQPLALFLAAGD